MKRESTRTGVCHQEGGFRNFPEVIASPKKYQKYYTDTAVFPHPPSRNEPGGKW